MAWSRVSENRPNGTLLNTVAAGSRKIGKVLDGASRGNSIALRGLSPPVVPSHLTRRLRFQQTTGSSGLLFPEKVLDRGPEGPGS